MMIKKIVVLYIAFVCSFTPCRGLSFAEQFAQIGYVEIADRLQEAEAFDALYKHFDVLITFLQADPKWAQKVNNAKERFIRSQDKNYYATDFFGFYDESKIRARSQISFYYSTHFHDFIKARYPELIQLSALVNFLESCRAIQQPYGEVFQKAADELGRGAMFSSAYEQVPILFKVVKYLSTYTPIKPHYDGTAFSLLLDSTDNQSLLLSAYKSVFTVDDFSVPTRMFPHSMLLIPGTLLSEFSIYPTPHVVMQSDNVRYATIAFAMRPYFILQKYLFSELPSFKT